jgi:hypothetical protein
MDREKVASELLKLAKELVAQPPSLRDLQKELEVLDELSDNIEDEIDTFSLHFKVAAQVDPEVKGQLDLLKKAREGLKKAEQVKSTLATLVESFPEDKTAKRSLNDADVMIKRFKRLESQASKVIGQLSKKQMPPALKKYADTIVGMLKRKVVDPKTVTVKPWQQSYWGGDVVFQMVIFVDPGPSEKKARFELEENTGKREGPQFNKRSMSPKEVVDSIVETLRGWKGLKSEQGVDRMGVAQDIANILNRVIRSWRTAWDTEPAEIQRGGLTVMAAYRSQNLPKEGAYDVGEAAYRDMVEDEIGDFSSLVTRKLAPYKSAIKNMEFDDGEKSWIYVYVHLK